MLEHVEVMLQMQQRHQFHHTCCPRAKLVLVSVFSLSLSLQRSQICGRHQPLTLPSNLNIQP